MSEQPTEGSGDPAPQNADEALGRALRGEYQVRIGDWMSRGWNLFTRAGGLFIGFGAIYWLLFWFAVPLLLLLHPVLIAGFLVGALQLRRGQRVQFSDFWLAFNDFLPLLLAWFVSVALMCAGICTCGLATIYLWVAYQFAYLLIVDRRLDFWTALETSRKVVTKQWISLFVFAVILLLLNLVAFLATLSLGLIVTIPFACCALVEAYADMFGARGGVPGRPAAPTPSVSPAPAPSPVS